ncbi:RcpC/CpaB family pilus assembly protein [Anaerorhabdus sp.]|uniref:RcpC/CpaB family pilus assembly protein n=1 Tax=Anaerorhabdus sp. TaxID=1872524 RepID=UPI002FC87012
MLKRIIAFLCSITILIGIDYFLVDYLSTKKINLVSVYVASRDIKPRTIITDQDIREIKIPQAYVLENVINNKNNLIGRITNIEGRIPKDSLFYETNLDKINAIPDAAVPLLENNQVAYVLNVNQSNNNFDTFTVGQKIDVYVTINFKNEPTIFDCLLESVRIVSIKDRKGLEISSKESTGSIQTLTLAIHENQIAPLSLASKLGTIELYATAFSKNTKKESILKEDSEIIKYIKENVPSMKD